VTCKCGAVSVDGGQEYLRRVGGIGKAIDHSWELSEELYNLCATVVQEAIDSGRKNKFGIANAMLRTLREADRIIADGEQRIMAHHEDMNEIMVVETDGVINRYKKVVSL
jgi:hypothetical protein